MKNHHLKTTALTFLMIFGASQLTGCASTGHKESSPATVSDNTNDAQFKNLITKMDDAGYEFNKINNPIFDEIGKTMAIRFKRQKTLLVSYRSKLEGHKDVASFLNANKGKNQNELKQEIVRFDSSANNESEKIGPKIEAFESATNEINQQNLILTKQLVDQGLKIAGLVKGKGLEQFVTASGFLAVTQLNNVRSAYSETADRLSLGKEANKFIDADLQTVSMVKETQKLVQAKSM
jgi:hypothetical protein